MTDQARGTFDVTLVPQQDTVGDPTVGRMSIDKAVHGDLDATSKGQMLAAMTDVEGSAGYVAIVPDSGTDDLVGLAGTMTIDIMDGKHLCTFACTLVT